MEKLQLDGNGVWPKRVRVDVGCKEVNNLTYISGQDMGPL